MIAQATGEKSWHEDSRFEADADPLAFCRAIKGSCSGLWSTEREKAPSSQSRDDHLKTVGRNREKSIRTVVMATPYFFNERMIGISVLQVKELTLMLHPFVQTLPCGHLQPSPLRMFSRVYQSRFGFRL
jgi:hypothetical protein